MADEKECPYFLDFRKEMDALVEEVTRNQHQFEDVNHVLDLIHEKLDKLEKSISQLLAIFNAGEGFITVIGWIGLTFKWLAIIGSVIAGFYFWVKSGWKT